MEQKMTEGGNGSVLYHRGMQQSRWRAAWHINPQHWQATFCPLTSPRTGACFPVVEFVEQADD